MSASTPNAFLNIDDAHLRVTSGNVYAQGLNISGISFSGVSGLQTVTNTGNVTTNTLEFKNGEKAFVATSNVDVKGSLDVANVATIYNGSNADYDQKQKFTSTVSASGNYFSNTLAVSTNGLYAIVGAHGEDKAYTFTRSGSTWTQENIFSSTAGSAFGYAVDISSDGTYAIVGGNGSASVFYRSSGSTWDSGTTLTAGGISVTTGYGASVSISDDGSYAIVGATGQNAVYIFRRTGTTTWDAGVKIALTGFTLGFSVAISGDGLYALLGAHAQHTAYVFKRTGAYIWSQQVKITESDSFGYSVALSTDGSRALIGATGGNGKAYSYERSGSDWSQNAIITASDAASGDAFGSAVSLSSDGSYALVGAPGNEKAYTFKNAGTVWSELGIETASDATAGHVFGRSVSISGDGIYALVGASGNEAAYSYERKETLVLDVRGEANVRTLNVSDDLTSNNLTVTGNLNVTTIRSDSNVVAEYTGPHDRPLRKYPEVALTQNDESATSGYVASGSSRHSASYEYYEAFDLKTNLTDDNTANTGLYGAWLSSDSRFDSNGDADLTTSNTFPGTSYRGEYCALKLPKAIKLDNFHIFPRGDASSYANSNPPKDLRIFGSNDGTTWTHVKQFQNLGFTGRSGLRLHVNDSNTYNEYAFFVEKVTVSSAGAGYCAISGIELYGYEEGSGSLDTTLKTVYNVPATTGTQLEVYYDAKDLTTMPTNTVTDLAGGDQNGAVSGHSPTLDSTDGIKSFKFDGTDDYIESTLTNDSGAWIFSKSLWFKQTTGVPGASLSCMSSIGDYSESDATFFYLNDTYILVSIYSSGAYFPAEWVVNEWTHAVAVLKGTTSSINDIELYINGKKVEATSQFGTATTRTLPANAQLRVGREVGVGTSYFTGSIANFRLYSKALNADQVKELYDYQKDYFLGSKSQVTLYKGHLGVGVTEPSGQLELAGDERIQEYPPGPMTGWETYMEGHGVFRAGKSGHDAYLGTWDRWKVFNKGFTTSGGTTGDSYHGEQSYSSSTGLYTGSESLGGIKGDYFILDMPYKISLKHINVTSANQNRSPTEFIILGSNDGSTWTQIKNFSSAFTGSGQTLPFQVNSNEYFSYFGMVVTKVVAASDGYLMLSEWQLFGTPGPTTLDKGSLTLGRSLDVPRISRYDVDTETPRPEKLVVDFDTTVNSSPTDISGKGNHGTFVGTAQYSSADKAFVFDGDSDYITVADTGADGNWAHSFSFWFKPTSDNLNGLNLYGLGNITGGGHASLLYVYTGTNATGTGPTLRVSLYGDGQEIRANQLTIQTNRWYHMTVTNAGGVPTSDNCKMYVDGVQYVTFDVDSGGGGFTDTLNLAAGTLDIGRQRNYNGGYFPGQISNFKLYNVALEPSEVRKLYNLGRTGRSMVISDTAVGIGKAPEAQLDVRGNISCDGVFRSENPIAFEAYYTDGTLSTTGTYLPNYVRYNYGGCYHQDTGRFYAPINGIYAFHWHAYTNQGESQSRIFIDVNGNDRGQKGNSIQHMGQQLSFSIYLNAGDYLLIKGKTSYPLYFHGYTNHNMYTGHLVIAM